MKPWYCTLSQTIVVINICSSIGSVGSGAAPFHFKLVVAGQGCQVKREGHLLAEPHISDRENLALVAKVFEAMPFMFVSWGWISCAGTYEASQGESVLTTATATQKLQYPLIKEYTVNYSRDPTIIEGIFLT